MARRFIRSPRSGHSRRLTEWTATVPEATYILLAASTAILDSTFITGDPETLVRVVGNLSVQSNQVAASLEPFGAVGIAVVSDQAVAIGVTAIPTPYTDAESDLWLLHRFWAAPIATSGSGLTRAAVDIDLSSKAMRKVSPDETLVLVMENGSSAAAAEYRLDLRILSKVA